MSRYLNEVTAEELKTIEELAKVFFTEEEVCVFMKFPWEEYKKAIKNKDHPVHMHYYSGWRQSEFELRKLIMNAAIAGSTPAQNIILEIQKKAFANRLK